MLETRKTVPGLRLLDKWAVVIGGGANHRMGLFDMMMIKDNHIAAAGGITAACRRGDEFLKARGEGDLSGSGGLRFACLPATPASPRGRAGMEGAEIEVETRTMDELREV